MPPRSRKATIKATKPKLPTKKKIVKTKKESSQLEETKSIVTNPVDRIYKTVTLENDDIEDGLWIMRKLGNGKYEAVNLNAVAFEDLCSEENEARMTAVPETVEVFKASQNSLKDITAKLERAVFTGNGKVFRLNKLPIELRYKIYEFALISDRGLYVGSSFEESCQESNLALGLLASCRSIHTECIKFLWKNTFNLNIQSIKTLRKKKDILIQNIRHVKCNWTGTYSRDAFIFGLISSFTKVESLVIQLSYGVVTGHSWYTRKPQRLHQDDDRIRKFSRINGFDKLISLRDINKVTVVTQGMGYAASDVTVTQAELEIFKRFLVEKLTTPVAPPVVFDPSSTPTRTSTRIQKLKNVKPIKYAPDVSDDEDDQGANDDDNDDDYAGIMSIAHITE